MGPDEAFKRYMAEHQDQHIWCVRQGWHDPEACPDKQRKEDQDMEHTVFYLTTKRSTGNHVERFTDALALWERVDQVSGLFDYTVSTSYLVAVTAK